MCESLIYIVGQLSNGSSFLGSSPTWNQTGFLTEVFDSSLGNPDIHMDSLHLGFGHGQVCIWAVDKCVWAQNTLLVDFLMASAFCTNSVLILAITTS